MLEWGEPRGFGLVPDASGDVMAEVRGPLARVYVVRGDGFMRLGLMRVWLVG